MKLNLSFYYFFFFSAVGVYVIFMPHHFKIIGYTPKEIGIIFASLPISRFITPFFFTKRAITPSIFKFSIFASAIIPLFLYFNNFYIYLLVFVILGILYAINYPYIEAIAIDKLKNHYGKTRLWGSVGFIVVALGLSYVHLNIITLYFLLNLLMAYCAYKFVDLDMTITKHFEKIDFSKEWHFWVALVLFQISFGGFYNFFTIYNLQNGISKEINGWLWSIGVFAEIMIFLSQHKFLTQKNAFFYLKLSILITAFRWFGFYLFAGNGVLIAILQIAHMFSFAVFHTSAILYISNKYKNKTLVQQFYSGIGYGIAAFLGSLLSGYLYGEFLFLYEGMISLCAFFVIWSKK